MLIRMERSRGALDKRRTKYHMQHAKQDEVVVYCMGCFDEDDIDPIHFFAGVFGIIPPEHSWRADAFTFFLNKHTDLTDSLNRSRFYHRSQYVPDGLPTKYLSINYEGDLAITSDWTAIRRKGEYYADYMQQLSEATHKGITTNKNLGRHLAKDMLSDSISSGSTIGHCLKPSNEAREHYWEAFQFAMAETYSEHRDGNIYYFSHSNSDNEQIENLGMVPFTVSDALYDIGVKSGAFPKIKTFATRKLLSSPDRQVQQNSGEE